MIPLQVLDNLKAFLYNSPGFLVVMLCRILYGNKIHGVVSHKTSICYDIIYLLTAIGLSPGGSSTVHIYTQTIHGTIQNK